MLANVMERIRVAVGSQPKLPNVAEGGLNLAQDGVVILRGALPSQEVMRVAPLCDAAFTGLTRASDPSAYANAAAWGGMSLDEMLGCMAEPEALNAIVDRLTTLLPHNAVLIRAFSVIRRRVKHRTSMPWHVDAEAANTIRQDPCVNFWVPFAPVGNGRSPTLEFVLGSASTMRSLPARRPSGETFRYDQWVQMHLGHCRRIMPTLEPGDVALFDHYTMHRTERVSGRFPVPRISAEIRFQCYPRQSRILDIKKLKR